MQKKHVSSTPFKEGGTFLMNFSARYASLYEAAIAECNNPDLRISGRIGPTPPNERSIGPLYSIHYIGKDPQVVEIFYQMMALHQADLLVEHAGINIDYKKIWGEHKGKHK